MFLIVVGCILLIIGLIIISGELINRIRCKKDVEGTVVGRMLRVEMGLRFGIMKNYYYPVYEYEVDGRKYYKNTKQCSRDENWYKPGDTGKISYCPENPEIIVAKGYYGNIIYGSVYVIIGILLTIWGSIYV